MKQVKRVILMVLCAVIAVAVVGCTSPAGETNLTEADWTAAVESIGSSSSTLRSVTANSGTGAMQGWTRGRTIKFDGTKIEYDADASGTQAAEKRFFAKEGEAYWVYTKNGDGAWIKTAETKEMYENVNLQSMLYGILKKCKFTDFDIAGDIYELKSDKLVEYAEIMRANKLSKLTISFSADKKIKEIFCDMAENKITSTITVSEYNKTIVTLPTVAVETELTEADWTAAVESIGSSSSTLRSVTANSGTGAMQGWTVGGTIKFDGTKIEYDADASGTQAAEKRFFAKEGEAYWVYTKNDDGTWTKTAETKEMYENVNLQSMIYDRFKKCKFADFNMAGDVYELKSDKLVEYAEIMRADNLSKLTISFSADKKIKEIFCDMAEDETTSTVTLSDYNKTTVTLPAADEQTPEKIWQTATAALAQDSFSIRATLVMKSAVHDSNDRRTVRKDGEKIQIDDENSGFGIWYMSKEENSYCQYIKNSNEWAKRTISKDMYDDLYGNNGGVVLHLIKQFRFADFDYSNGSFLLKEDKYAEYEAEFNYPGLKELRVSIDKRNRFSCVLLMGETLDSGMITTQFELFEYGTVVITLPNATLDNYWVTEEEWRTAFSSLSSEENLTCDIEMLTGDSLFNEQFLIDGRQNKFLSNNYFTIENGKYYRYELIGGSSYEKYEIDQKSYDNFLAPVSFSAFSSFSYADFVKNGTQYNMTPESAMRFLREYVGTDVEDASVTVSFNENQKIGCIDVSFKIQGENNSAKFTLSKYGTTTITLPEAELVEKKGTVNETEWNAKKDIFAEEEVEILMYNNDDYSFNIKQNGGILFCRKTNGDIIYLEKNADSYAIYEEIEMVYSKRVITLSEYNNYVAEYKSFWGSLISQLEYADFEWRTGMTSVYYEMDSAKAGQLVFSEKPDLRIVSVAVIFNEAKSIKSIRITSDTEVNYFLEVGYGDIVVTLPTIE